MRLKTIYLLVCFMFIGTVLTAQKYITTQHDSIVTTYNGIHFSSEKTLFENLSGASNFGTFADIIEPQQEAIFSDSFMGTVFVFSDDSIQKLKDDETGFDFEDAIIQKEILAFYTVPGRLDIHAIKKAIEKGDGVAYFKTLSGEKLRAILLNDIVVLIDNSGNSANVIATDFYHKHGFFHIVEGLVFPDSTK